MNSLKYWLIMDLLQKIMLAHVLSWVNWVLLQDFGADYHQRWVAGGWNFTQFSTSVAFVLTKDYRCKGYNHLKYQPVFSLNPPPNLVKLETTSETIACDILERWIYEHIAIGHISCNFRVTPPHYNQWRSWNPRACFWNKLTFVVWLYQILVDGDTPLKINDWNIIMEVRKIMFLSKWVICSFHVYLPGCSLMLCLEKLGDAKPLPCSQSPPQLNKTIAPPKVKSSFHQKGILDSDSNLYAISTHYWKRKNIHQVQFLLPSFFCVAEENLRRKQKRLEQTRR